MKSRPSLYLCLCLHQFSLQTLGRSHELRSDIPYVVIAGPHHTAAIVAVNTIAASRGLAPGMPSMQAKLVDNAVLLPRSTLQEEATRLELLQVCMQLSPLIEDCSSEDECVLILDVTASSHLFPSHEAMALHLTLPLAALQLQATTVMSYDFHTCRLLARSYKDCRFICIAKKDEARALAQLPVITLALTLDQHETFVNWGIHTIEDLARLPLTELTSRMGQQAVALHELASGCHSHVFRPLTLPGEMKQYVSFDTPVDLLDSLLFSISAMLKQLIGRAEDELKAIASLTLSMTLDNKAIHVRTIRPAIPSVKHALLLKLIQLDINANPPTDSIGSLTLSASIDKPHKVQTGMFSPLSPEISQFHVTLARIASIVGKENVGSPILENSHRQVATTLDEFSTLRAPDSSIRTPLASMAMARIRSSKKLAVKLQAGEPSTFFHLGNLYRVIRAYGPWRSQGRWWTTGAWNLEQWDIVAAAGETSGCLYCCIIHDRFRNSWLLEGIYD